MPHNSETSPRSRVTGGSPEQLDRILLGVCVGLWLAALGAGVAAVVTLVDLGTKHPSGSGSLHTPWLLYSVIGISAAVILGAIPLLLRARRGGAAPLPLLGGGPADAGDRGTAGEAPQSALRSFDDPVVRRYSASPATSMVGFPVAAVDQLWLRCTVGIAAAMGAATLLIFLGSYMLADRHDELAWMLLGLALIITVGMVAIPWYCLRGLHAVLEASAEDSRAA
ncbi:DUF2561 family protein [Mycobacterium sp. CBMA293]|nr:MULTISPECIES: DUF2561 family protein [unclassified Mycolicibacterium]MUL60186.1 DUF2561 family protein [Mycolicibacterium sp. CBMA 335]MUL72973.1 DUF2561 family protein [Mycolicibacterium sp. CBMA 311]MUM08067.1 hypothetical protein [Mycolicibacterium sp. CBMA 213]MUM14124.1 DUF2561 family protein [Mycolicibacterium sp. CBMA 293]MUL45516.1 DUF2561 family protein [Mycolicibacterium sp. CBMA 360]